MIPVNRRDGIREMGHQFRPKGLAALGLVDAPPERAFDDLTALAQCMLRVPVALVSLVEPENDRQYFKSAVGLPEPWATRRQTPLSHSFCKHVRATGRALVVTDARDDPRVSDNLAVRDLGVIAYLGLPVRDPLGQPIGAFCVIDTVPRDWSAEQIDEVSRFAAVASEQIRLKAALLHMTEAQATAEAAATSRSNFLAYMSHELRTPLHGILGLANLLHRDLPEGEPRNMAALIQQTGSGLLRQLNDILDLAKVDAGRLALDPVAFRLDALLRELMLLHRVGAAEKGVVIALDLEPGCDITLMGDDHRIKQVIGNILGNAVKFTDAGAVRVHASVTLGNDGAADVQVSVADTGPGMTPEVVATLFQPFLQADPSIARTHGGSGLGMTIVKAIMDAMQGRIDVDSAPGAGTTMRMTLPLRRAVPVANAASSRPSPLPTRAAPRGADRPVLRVLVADDDSISRLILEKSLTRAGMQVTLARDGNAALAALGSTRFDALVFDFRMPGLSGPELIARVRAPDWSGPNADTPAIAISAEGDTVLHKMATRTGFAESFCKPVRGDFIADALRRLSAGVQA